MLLFFIYIAETLGQARENKMKLMKVVDSENKGYHAFKI